MYKLSFRETILCIGYKILQWIQNTNLKAYVYMYMYSCQGWCGGGVMCEWCYVFYLVASAIENFVRLSTIR